MNLEHLLRFYPPAYRQARGTELLDTLAAATGDHRRPPAREVAALILGGLRARAGHDHRRTARQSWLAASRIAALMLLIYGTAGSASVVFVGFEYRPSDVFMALGTGVLAVVAVVAVLRHHYAGAAVFAAAAFALAMGIALSGPGPYLGGFLHFPLAIVLLLILARHRPDPISGLLTWAPAIPLVVIGADIALGTLFPDVAGILRFGTFLAVCLGGLLWLAVDERMGMAVGILYGSIVGVHVTLIAYYAANGSVLPSWTGLLLDMALTGVPAAVLLVLGGTTARRQARI